MLKTLKQRQRFAGFILLIATLGAIYIAIPGDGVGMPQLVRLSTAESGFLIDIIDALNRKASAHLVGHVVIFGGVAGLLGHWGLPDERGDARLAMRYVLIGAVVMEASQAVVGHADDTLTTLLVGISFDFLVDILSAIMVLWLTRRYADPLTLVVQRLRLA